MDLTRVLVVSLFAVTLCLGLQKAGIIARHAPAPPHPPTPAFLATQAAAEAARAAAAVPRAGPVAAMPPAAAVPAPAQAADPPAPGTPAETIAALPEGPGREATFHACTACHGTALISRSRLSRDRWDELMDWMSERHGMPPLEGEARIEIVDYLAEHFRPQRRGGGGGSPFLAAPDQGK